MNTNREDQGVGSGPNQGRPEQGPPAVGISPTNSFGQPAPVESRQISDDLDSVSEVDREPLNGGERRESNWKDARKSGLKGTSQSDAKLEDGAD